MTGLLEVEGLTVAFRDGGSVLPVVRGVSFTLERGRIMALVGESGSGKSVTALALMGLLPSAAIVGGRARLEGSPLLGLPEAALAAIRGRRMAMIFQSPATAFNPVVTIGAQLAAAIGRHRGLRHRDALAAAAASLADTRLPDPALVLEKYPHQLSGGQLQRVMIALALACRAEVLIADEPTTALDVTVQAQIALLLRELADVRGIGVLFISHDLGLVATLADRVAVMYAGRVVEQGEARSVFGDPGHPYTTALLAAVPRLGTHAPLLATIPGRVPGPREMPAGCPFHPRCDGAEAGCRATLPPVVVIAGGHDVACHRRERRLP